MAGDKNKPERAVNQPIEKIKELEKAYKHGGDAYPAPKLPDEEKKPATRARRLSFWTPTERTEEVQANSPSVIAGARP